MNLTEWNARLHGLVIFRALLDDDVIAKFVDLTDRMTAASQSTGAVCDAAASFEAALFEHTTNFGEYLSAAVLEAETVCVRQAAVSEVPPVLQTALDNELDFLRQLCSLTLDELLDAAGAADELPFLPRWETKAIDLHAAYAQRMSEVGKKGYGMFAKHHVFTVENGQLVPVRYPDPQRLDELPGYEQEREKVIANTRALLAGMPANNVLLYGDAGTGKSSTVKAIANEFAADGLRLVEVKKNQLYQIPDLMDKLAANPLKFILFIDDLSFTLPRNGIVGVIGPNGVGKSTLFKTIVGLEPLTSGSLKIGDTVKISYVDQNREGLDPNKNLWEAVSGGLDFIEVAGVEVPTRAYVASFGFKGSDQQKLTGVLSGGERNRLNLALTLKQGGNLLLLDEPTNDLDVETLESLENALLGFPGCAVVISHDRWFLDRIATHILSFEGDSKVVFYEGSYSEYEAWKKAQGGDTQPHRVRYKKLIAD